MPFAVTLPDDLAYELDLRVNAGEFASRDSAAAFFLRKGLASRGIERRPLPPGGPPPVRDPGDDRPIQVDPTDVNWARDAR